MRSVRVTTQDFKITFQNKFALPSGFRPTLDFISNKFAFSTEENEDSVNRLNDNLTAITDSAAVGEVACRKKKLEN